MHDESAALIADRDLAKVHSWAAGQEDAGGAQPAQTPQLDSVGSMLSGLESRLQNNPDDKKGWSLLAQSYAFVGRMDDAYSAIDRAVALGADRKPLERRVLAAHSGGS